MQRRLKGGGERPWISGQRGLNYLQMRLKKIADDRPELRQLWEKEVGRHTGEFLKGREKADPEGPSWKTLWRMARVAGMTIEQFLFEEIEPAPARSAPLSNAEIDDLDWAIREAEEMIRRVKRNPDPGEIARVAVLMHWTLLRRPADRRTDSDRKEIVSQYDNVVPLLLHRGRG